jgi:hypothetical protein
MNNNNITNKVLYRKNATYTYEQFYKIAVRLLYTKVENTQKLIEHHGSLRPSAWHRLDMVIV